MRLRLRCVIPPLAVALLARTGVVHAWGAQGHESIAAVAEDKLSPATKAAIAPLLSGGATLSSIATWPDDVRQASRGQGPLKNNPEAKAFNLAFPKNGDWHFVDLPLASTDYQDNGPFSGENDIVHALNRCIAILESPTATPNFSKTQALRWLVHLVGDIHQPLHTGAGFYKLKGTKATLVIDPTDAVGKPDDRGGNELCFGKITKNKCATTSELHGLWDGVLVGKVAGGPTTDDLVSVLKAKLADSQFQATNADVLKLPSGDFHQWAEAWAGQSVHQAHEAYHGINKFGPANASGSHINPTGIVLPKQYKADQLDRATAQLAAAAIHLQELMDRIQWK